MINNRKKKYGLPKEEHLIGRDAIANLFDNGKRTTEQPISAIYIKTENSKRIRVLFYVAKRIHRRAVDRNHYKRLMREAYRLNKLTFLELVGDISFGLDIAFSITNKGNVSLRVIEEKIVSLLNNIAEKQN